MLQYLV